MWYGHMGGMGYGLGFGLGWIFQIAFWIIIIWLIVSLFRHHRGDAGCCGKGAKSDMGGHSDSGSKEDSATEILKKRYAKGEISKDEFERIKKELE